MPFSCSLLVHFGHHRNTSCYVCGFWLCPAHSTQTGSDKQFSFQVFTCSTDLASCVQDGYRRPVNDALRAYVHVRPGGHLSILCNTQRIVLFPVFLTRIIRYHHAV